MKNKLKIVFIVISFVVVGCGSGIKSESIEAYGGANLIIKSGSNQSQIKKYVVKIEGSGIDEAIIAEFDGSSENGVIDNIPPGYDRIVTITAINEDEKTIREGEKYDVVISPGAIAEVEIVLEAVPIFTNLYDGNFIFNNRLKFEVLSDPEDLVEILDRSESSETPIYDISNGAGDFSTDLNNGRARVSPDKALAGKHVYEVVSKITGRSSSVTVHVLDGSKNSPAPFYSGASSNLPGVARLSTGTSSLELVVP